MRTGNLYIILLISTLLLPGCTKNNNSRQQETRRIQNPDISTKKKQFDTYNLCQHQLTESRFQLDPGDNQYKITKVEPEPDETFQYYRPASRLEKQPTIPANDILKRNRYLEAKTSINGNLITPRESALIRAGRTSRDIFFTAIFDNDIFDYTDYYYTNGISLELYHPSISSFPLSRVLPGLHNSLNYYSLTLVQNMYTPRKLEEIKVRVGDRPFAAYLTIGHQRISLSAERRLRLQSEFVLGVIGPASLGNVAQDLIHSNTPVGWVNQVKNDFIVNYSIRFDHGICSGKSIELAVIGGGQAGTLYDNIMAGFYFQLGKANDRYGSVFQTTGLQKPFKKRVRYYFALDIKNKLIVYDATLQGGMFNRESIYKLNGNQVNRYVFTGTASFGLGLGRYSLEAEQVFLSPEFDGGRKHLWFRIKNIFYLN